MTTDSSELAQWTELGHEDFQELRERVGQVSIRLIQAKRLDEAANLMARIHVLDQLEEKYLDAKSYFEVRPGKLLDGVSINELLGYYFNQFGDVRSYVEWMEKTYPE